MLTVSTPTGNAIAARNTRPGYLLEIGWSTVSRLTSGDDLAWNGYVWVAADIDVQNLRWSQQGLVAATIKLGNALQQWSALALNEGVAGVPVRIWAFDQAATATGDPVLRLDGEGGALLGVDDDAIMFAVASLRARSLKSPRFRIIAANGFAQLPVAGSTFRWGNERYVLRQER